VTEAARIRILVADDHTVIREGLAAIIATQSDMQLVGEASDGVEAVQKAAALRPDVILMDLMMPRKDGLAAIRDIKQSNPDAHILVLTSFADDEKVFPAIKAGALGYLLKDTSRDQLFQAIRDVARGQASLHPQIALKVMHELNQPSDLPPTVDPLTERELETLRLIARGLTNQEIGDMLCIHERTVTKYVSGILSKLHLANRTQAALYALRQGLASLDDEAPAEDSP
jgi:NarL family two-component system response regulator LiaR